MIQRHVVELQSLGLPRARVLIIVPPFGSCDRPALGAHLLAANAALSGFAVDIYYANLDFARVLGVPEYCKLGDDYSNFAGERFFGPTVFREGLEFPEASRWIANTCSIIVEAGYEVVGCTTSFQQTTASLALLSGVKRLKPEISTLLGGSNCEGEMAKGLLSLDAGVDFVFSGESERTFVEYLSRGSRSATRIITGMPNSSLDQLPEPDYESYFTQLRAQLPEINVENVWLLFESSRGCWWGQKHHCTFCGLNGTGMKFREKSPSRFLDERRTAAKRYPTKRICMTDNIMPYSFFRTFLPITHAAG